MARLKYVHQLSLSTNLDAEHGESAPLVEMGDPFDETSDLFDRVTRL
jgi:hypothetical protein